VPANPVLDLVAKIPGAFKYCAVKATPGGPVTAHSGFGRGQVLARVQAQGGIAP